MKRGLFFTLEGIDGSGKGTQFERLKAYLAAAGKDLLCLREPGGTAIGEKIRQLLLERENETMTAETELLLFAAARAQNTAENILPALEAGRWVLCDRFFDSTLAYQAGGRGLDREPVRQSILLATGGLEPDLTFYFDLSPEEADARRRAREAESGGRADRIEAEDLSFDRRVREEYLRLADAYPRIRVIDASLPPEAVWEQVKTILDKFLQNRLSGSGEMIRGPQRRAADRGEAGHDRSGNRKDQSFTYI